MSKSKSTRPTKAQATKPVTSGISVSLFEVINNDLMSVDAAIDQIDDMVSVCVGALLRQDGASAVATTLETAVVAVLNPGRDRLQDAMDSLRKMQAAVSP